MATPVPTNQGDSFAIFTGDGISDTYPLGFEYIKAFDIKVILDTTVLEGAGVDYTVIGDNVVFNDPPAFEVDVRLVRATDRNYDSRLVDFRSFGSITENEMDLNQKQIWYLIQEAMETDDGGNINPNAEYISWDALQARWTATRTGADQKIGNVRFPDSSDEVANKQYVDDIAEWGIAGIPQGWTFTTTGTGSGYILDQGSVIDARYIIVALDGVLQVPLVDYSVSQGDPDSTLVFETDPPANMTLSVMNFGKTRYINITTLTAGSVDTAALQSGCVTTPKIANEAVTMAKLADGSVGPDQLVDDSVGTADIQDDSITYAKLQLAPFTAPFAGTDKLLRVDNGTGALSLGDITSADVTDWLAALALQPISRFAPAQDHLELGTSYRIRNCADPLSPQDVATKNYVDGLGSVGPRMDLLYHSYAPSGSQQVWQLWSDSAAWFRDTQYMFYTVTFVNWRNGPSGKFILRFDGPAGAATEPEVWHTYTPQGQNYDPDYGITWTCIITNPRNNVTRITVGNQWDRWNDWSSQGQPSVGPKYGARMRVENGSIIGGADGCSVMVYGHRGL